MKGLEKFESDTYYHIVNHAVGNESLFRTEENYHYFLKKYAQHLPSVCSTLAYCLMPNHIHILILTHSEDVLTKHTKYKEDIHKLVMQQISNLLNGYTKAYNKMYDRRGALWIDYTKRFKIDSDSYLTSAINYIHQNPVKHGFAKKIHDWQFSSYTSHLSEKRTLLLRQEVLNWFGGMDEYVSFHISQSADLLDEWES